MAESPFASNNPIAASIIVSRPFMMSSPVMATRGVGIDSELRVLFVHIQDRTSRETDTPPIRQFRTERQAAATSRTVTHDRDLRKETHHIDKIVRSAVRMPVSQDDDRAQPTSAVRRGKIDRIGLGKIVMPVSFLILRVTRQNPSSRKREAMRSE